MMYVFGADQLERLVGSRPLQAPEIVAIYSDQQVAVGGAAAVVVVVIVDDDDGDEFHLIG